jgi:hypothetical protein
MWQRALHRSQPFFVLIAVLLMAFLLRSQWAELQSHPWRLHPGWLALSALLMLSSWALEIAIWQRLLQVVGGVLPYPAAWRIWFLSALVRYIPGNIWQPLSMTLYCQRWGIRSEATLTSVALYQLITLLAVAPIAAIYFLWSANWGLLSEQLGGYTAWLMGMVMLPVALFLGQPAWLFALINRLLRRVGRPTLTARLARRRLGGLMMLGVIDWLLWGATFATLTWAIQSMPVTSIFRLTPHLVGVYATAYAIGLISLVTPSGFGVREGALYLLLAPLLGAPVVTVAALAMRLWTMLGELLMAGLSTLTNRALSPDSPVTMSPSDAMNEYIVKHENS